MGQVGGLKAFVVETLTSKQISILEWIADGKRNTEIAKLEGMTVSVLQSEVTRAMDSTGTNTRSGLVAFALRKGIIK